MKQTLCLTISIILILPFPISMYAVEDMSKDEIDVREEHDKIKKRLFECLALHKVDAKNIDEECKDEQIEIETTMAGLN